MCVNFFLKVFEEWNKGELDSFLIEITKDILAFKDSDGTPLVEKIRDSAGQVKKQLHNKGMSQSEFHLAASSDSNISHSLYVLHFPLL